MASHSTSILSITKDQNNSFICLGLNLQN